MIISEKTKKINFCESKNPLEDIFESLNQRKKKHNMANGVPIYFGRFVGVDDKQEYIELLVKVENKLKSLSGIRHNSDRIQDTYLIISKGMDKNLSQEEVEYLANIWSKFKGWYDDNSRKELDLYKLELEDRTGLFDWEYKRNLAKILEMFDSIEKSASTTIRKNFMILLIFWSNRYLVKLLSKIKAEGGAHIPKILYYGKIKRNEAYFLIFAAFFGCDVVYINPEEDNELSRIDPCNKFSSIKYLRSRTSLESINNPFLQENISMQKHDHIDQTKKTPVETTTSNVALQVVAAMTTTVAVNETVLGTIESTQRNYILEQEKCYEELAGLSASIVMINIYRHDFFPAGIGSGVVIDDNGLILTNYHVVKDGGIFGIVFENDEHEYISHKLLDYNLQSDLALIRIDLKTTPIPIKSQNKLKRGQQIVAIGSPLGLMNTISDGIIAGFRKINELEYIQITAPISPGSSGGALIDKYGDLIGITTAGFSDGQNLNLAVPISELSRLNNTRLK